MVMVLKSLIEKYKKPKNKPALVQLQLQHNVSKLSLITFLTC